MTVESIASSTRMEMQYQNTLPKFQYTCIYCNAMLLLVVVRPRRPVQEVSGRGNFISLSRTVQWTSTTLQAEIAHCNYSSSWNFAETV